MSEPAPGAGARGLFASKREGRLWALAGAVIVSLWLSLGLARSLVEILGHAGVNVVLFLACCLTILVVVIVMGVVRRPNVVEIAILFGVAAAYLLIFVRMTVATERSHLVEYGVLGVIVYEALCERRKSGRPVPMPALFAFIVTSLTGTLDELIQLFVPGRVFDPVDILFNVVAVFMAVGACASLRWARTLASR